MPVFISEMQIMEKLSPVLTEVNFSQNFHQNFDMFIDADFSINQKMESTIILLIENITLYLMISHFYF